MPLPLSNLHQLVPDVFSQLPPRGIFSQLGWEPADKCSSHSHLPGHNSESNFCTVPRMDEVLGAPQCIFITLPPSLLQCPTSHFQCLPSPPRSEPPGLQFLFSGSAQDLHAHLYTKQCSSWKEGRPWTCSRLEVVGI